MSLHRVLLVAALRHELFDLRQSIIDFDLQKDLTELRSRLCGIAADAVCGRPLFEFIEANEFGIDKHEFGGVHDVRVTPNVGLRNAELGRDVLFLIGVRFRVVVGNIQDANARSLPRRIQLLGHGLHSCLIAAGITDEDDVLKAVAFMPVAAASRRSVYPLPSAEIDPGFCM